MTDRTNHDAKQRESALADTIRDEIERSDGRISFARFMELALYHPELGYYVQPSRRPGRGGDFLTAPEASPLFGLTLANQVAECWERLGCPDAWTIREHGSGIGGLAYDVMAGLSDINSSAFEALQYEMIELNPEMRSEAVRSMTAVGLADRVTVLAPDRIHIPVEGVLLANEVADAMPVHRIVVRDDGWREFFVASHEHGFAWVEGEPSRELCSIVKHLQKQLGSLPVGSILDVSPATRAWFSRSLRSITRGFAIVIDYGYEANELYSSHRLEGTLRAYREHTVTDDPLIDPGKQDLTAHVDFSQLIEAGRDAGWTICGLTTQGAFLASLGLGDHMVRLQKEPDTTAEDYYSTQAVIMRLIDPAGLGRFRVLIMGHDVPIDPSLRGFSVVPPSF